MNVSRMTRRIAVSGVATAIAAGALVGAASTAANAVTADGSYTCTIPGMDPAVFPLHLDVPILPPTANAGTLIPAGLLQATTTLTIPASAAGALGTYGVTGGTISDFGMLVGSTTAPAPLTFTSFTDGTEVGSKVASTQGSNTPFSLPKAGTYDVTLPAAFSFVPTTANGPLPISVPCTTATPTKLASIRLDKNLTSMAAKAPTSIKKGSAAKVVTTLASLNQGTPVPTGKVVAKLGTKTVGTGTLSNGRAVLKLVKLPVGKDKVSVKYAGDGFTAANKVPVTIKVTR